ncbi:MAG: electron transporter [Frankiales bacterium]|nr:electron transporter [Frankiales bacterium]
MAGGNAIRGSRVGAGPMGENERGESAARQFISFFCANGHETTPAFAAEADIPDTWDCPRCGYPAGQESATPPSAPRNEPYKTHLAYVKERRTDADGDAILEEALTRLRARRGEN